MEDTGERLIVKGNEQTLTYGEHLSRYKSVLSIVKDKVVLDVASGSGYGSQMLASSAKKVTGIDYSAEAIKYSKLNYPAKNLTYKTGDAHNIELENESQDVVVSLETIEHLADPAKFVKEVKRVLKTDGVFVVSTPNDDEFMEGNEFHLHEFHLGELKKLIEKNFKNFEFYYQGTWFTAGLLGQEKFNAPFKNEKLVTSKTFGQKNAKAIFFIAIASDGKLPPLDENIVISDRWSTKEYIEHELRQQHAIKQSTELRKQAESLLKQLEHIRNTRWWKIRANTIGALRKAKRLTRNGE